MQFPFAKEYFAGGNSTHAARFSLTNLGVEDRRNLLYLSVSVFPTDFAMKGRQWATVKLNGEIIAAYCTPDQSCGKHWFSCVADLEVARNVSHEHGGSLDVEVSAVGVLHSECDRHGHPLYVRVDLTERGAREVVAISAYYFMYATAGLFFVLLVALLVHVCVKKEQNFISVFVRVAADRWRVRRYGVECTGEEATEASLAARTLEFVTDVKVKLQSRLFPPKVSSEAERREGSSNGVLGSVEVEVDVEHFGDDSGRAAVPWEDARERELGPYFASSASTSHSAPVTALVPKPAQEKAFALADMDLLLLRAQSKAKIHPSADWAVGGGGSGGNSSAEDLESGKGKGFVEELQSWDELDDEHEPAPDGRAKEGNNVGSQYSKLGRMSTMSWLMSNDVDA